jgi:hypothetical protein
MQDKEHISIDERTRTLTYLTKQILGFRHVEFEDDLWRHAIAIAWQLLQQELSRAAARTIRVFLSAYKKPYAAWDRITQVWKDTEDDPMPLLEKLQSLSEEVSWAELSLQDELPQEVEAIERLIEIPPGSKRKQYPRTTHCKRNDYYPTPEKTESDIEPSMYTRYKRRREPKEEQEKKRPRVVRPEIRKKRIKVNSVNGSLKKAVPVLTSVFDESDSDPVGVNTSGDEEYLSESPPPLDDETFQLLYGDGPLKGRSPSI